MRVADPLFKVELNASFWARLNDLEAFLLQADAGFAFDDLFDVIRHHRQLSFDFASLWPTSRE